MGGSMSCGMLSMICGARRPSRNGAEWLLAQTHAAGLPRAAAVYVIVPLADLPATGARWWVRGGAARDRASGTDLHNAALHHVVDHADENGDGACAGIPTGAVRRGARSCCTGIGQPHLR
jgi:hypothetical protein